MKQIHRKEWFPLSLNSNTTTIRSRSTAYVNLGGRAAKYQESDLSTACKL